VRQKLASHPQMSPGSAGSFDYPNTIAVVNAVHLERLPMEHRYGFVRDTLGSTSSRCQTQNFQSKLPIPLGMSRSRTVPVYESATRQIRSQYRQFRRSDEKRLIFCPANVFLK
jgi:hypothetical protein